MIARLAMANHMSAKTQYRKAYRLVRLNTDREIMMNNTLFSREIFHKALRSYYTRNNGRYYIWRDLIRGARFWEAKKDL